ncbi:MAG: hypothetical protein LBT05_13975 [Planctomycetaceae bacterium]|jgi:hypothetical protein|nr:hypothetical protein [Planctomycetaceae bacterium]
MSRVNFCVTETHETATFAIKALAPFSEAAQKENSLAFFMRSENDVRRHYSYLSLLFNALGKARLGLC